MIRFLTSIKSVSEKNQKKETTFLQTLQFFGSNLRKILIFQKVDTGRNSILQKNLKNLL